MVLHRKRRERLVAHALDGAVVEIDVRDLQASWNRLRHDGKVVVLACDLHLARCEVLHGVVAAVVPEFETTSLCATRERQKLVPKADSHYRNNFFDRINKIDRITFPFKSCKSC